MDVVVDFEALGGERRHTCDRFCVDLASVECGLASLQTHGRAAHADRADMWRERPALSIRVVEQRDAGERKVALAPSELLERPAPVRLPGRQADADDDF